MSAEHKPNKISMVKSNLALELQSQPVGTQEELARLVKAITDSDVVDGSGKEIPVQERQNAVILDGYAANIKQTA